VSQLQIIEQISVTYISES